MVIDTYELVSKLQAVHFTQDQAKAISDILKMAEISFAENKERLDGNKQNIELLELNLKRDIKELELRLESRIKEVEFKIAETKSELVRWVVSVVFGVGLLQTVIISGLIFRLVGHL